MLARPSLHESDSKVARSSTAEGVRDPREDGLRGDQSGSVTGHMNELGKQVAVTAQVGEEECEATRGVLTSPRGLSSVLPVDPPTSV